MMKPLLMATLCHRGRLFTETIGDLQSAMSILFLLVTNALLNRKGQPIIQVGLLWIPHSIEAGLFVSNVCSVAMLFFLNCFFETVLICEALSDPTVSTGGFIRCIELWLSFAPCMCVFCIVRCVNMFCCGKLCALVLSLCDFTFYSCKGDDDIKIQRRHIKLGNKELKKQFATTDRWAAGTEATELLSTEFHPNVALTNTKWSGKNSSTWWLVWHMALCTQSPLSFWLLPVSNDKRENSFRWKIEGKSGEKLWNTVLLSGVLILLDCVWLS